MFLFCFFTHSIIFERSYQAARGRRRACATDAAGLNCFSVRKRVGGGGSCVSIARKRGETERERASAAETHRCSLGRDDRLAAERREAGNARRTDAAAADTGTSSRRSTMRRGAPSRRVRAAPLLLHHPSIPPSFISSSPHRHHSFSSGPSRHFRSSSDPLHAPSSR